MELRALIDLVLWPFGLYGIYTFVKEYLKWRKK